MSIQKIIQESINGNPLEMKEALAEELRNRIALALEAKMSDDEEDEEDTNGGDSSDEDNEDEDEDEDMKKEEVEQIDELKKSTLASYVSKAADNAAMHGIKYGEKKAQSDEMDRMMNRHMSYSDKDQVRKIMKTTSDDVDAPRRKAAKRLAGISMAAKKLAKESFDLSDYTVEELEDFMMSEDFEQLDEISKKTLASYVQKSIGDVRNYGAARARGKDDADTIRKAKNREAGIRLATDKIAGDTTWDYHKSGKKSDEYTMKPNEKKASLKAKQTPAAVLNKK